MDKHLEALYEIRDGLFKMMKTNGHAAFIAGMYINEAIRKILEMKNDD